LLDIGFDCVISVARMGKESFLEVCGLFVDMDSGAMCLSDAVRTKCIAAFGYANPFQNGKILFQKL